jgi:sugar phosphate isomerase/epimerase
MNIKNRMKCAVVDDKVMNIALSYQPEIMEFFLFGSDMYGNHLKKLEDSIVRFQEKGIKIYLHHPSRRTSDSQYLDILENDPVENKFYLESSKILAELCHKYDIKCVIHAHYTQTESSRDVSLEKTLYMREKIEKILSFSGKAFLWENTIEGLFSYSNPYLIEHLIKPLNLRLNHDISHSLISFKGDNEKLISTLSDIEQYTDYFHVVDTFGLIHDSLELGLGITDWERVKPFLINKDYIFEITLSDLNDFTPMIRSKDYLNCVKGSGIYR